MYRLVTQSFVCCLLVSALGAAEGPIKADRGPTANVLLRELQAGKYGTLPKEAAAAVNQAVKELEKPVVKATIQTVGKVVVIAADGKTREFEVRDFSPDAIITLDNELTKAVIDSHRTDGQKSSTTHPKNESPEDSVRKFTVVDSTDQKQEPVVQATIPSIGKVVVVGADGKTRELEVRDLNPKQSKDGSSEASIRQFTVAVPIRRNPEAASDDKAQTATWGPVEVPFDIQKMPKEVQKIVADIMRKRASVHGGQVGVPADSDVLDKLDQVLQRLEKLEKLLDK